MKIVVAGDFVPTHRVVDIIERQNYTSVLDDVRRVTGESDYAIVNLECPVVEGNAVPIEKEGPNLKCSKKAIDALKWAGFNCFTLANNHFFDYGENGVHCTLQQSKSMNVDTVGGGMNLEESGRILYKDIAGQKLAIINCCEHEFSIADTEKAGSNPLNPIKQYYSILEAKSKADFVLVIVHGGNELFQLPTPRMIEVYRFFVDAGADAVVNHHQHCFSGYESYNGKPIIYGLGNLCFDNPSFRNEIWNYGYMVAIDFSNSLVGFSIYPYQQCCDKPRVELLPKDTFDEDIRRLNSIIANTESLDKAVKCFYDSCIKGYIRIFEPIYNRFFFSARQRGWLPSLIGKRRKIVANNFIRCESHRDKLEYWLNK